VIRCRATAILLFALALVVSTHQATAQQHPNVEKGFKPDHAYAVGEIDAVNLFNGNLTVSIPIGGSYSVGGALSYGFTMVYSGNNWDYEELRDIQVSTGKLPPDPPSTSGMIRWAVPYQPLNAGMGWLFSLGRLIQTPPGRGSELVYQAPDGSEHLVGSEDGITLDGTYIRQTVVRDGETVQKRILEFPDGTIKEFAWGTRLTKIRDRFGNAVAITYYDNTPAASAAGVPAPGVGCGTSWFAWKIEDPHRVHYVYFTPPSSAHLQYFRERVCQASLAAFDAVRADYLFSYTDRVISRQKVISREAYDPAMRPSETLSVPLLSKIELPYGSTYEMLYDVGMYKAEGAAAEGVKSDSPLVPNQMSALNYGLNPGSYSGHLVALRMPTKGRYEWDYQRFAFPPTFGDAPLAITCEDSQDDPKIEWKCWDVIPNERWHPTVSAAVLKKTKRYVEAATSPENWHYVRSSLNDEFTRSVAVTRVDAPDGSSTESYFSLYRQEFEDERDFDYGAPYTRRVDAENPYKGMYISSRTTVPGTSATRRSYVTYEWDPTSTPRESHGIHNRRLKSRLTVFEDGHETSEVYSDFDGLGHYRTTTTEGTAGPVKRVTWKNYNPTVPPNGHRTIAPSEAWLTETFDTVETADLDPVTGAILSKSRQELCFDSLTGRLSRMRSLRGATASPSDLLAVFKDENASGGNIDGNVSQEEYYGGDDMPLTGASDTCSLSLNTPKYRLLHEYQFGSRKSTHYDGSLFKVLDLTIDSSSGLPSSTRDSAGVGTTLTYDLLGRLTRISPVISTENRATSKYLYAEATEAAGPSVTALLECPAGSETCIGSGLPEARYYYDSFGRLVQQRSSMGTAGTSAWSASAITYEAGRKKTSSVATGVSNGSFAALTPPPGQTVWTYDTLGRTKAIKQPDQSQVTFAYPASNVVARTTTIMTDTGAADVTTTETSDALGRLVKVTEDSTGAALSTLYDYDAGDRLVKVTAGSDPGSQLRTFSYDGAGLLLEEDHPELAKTYYTYDARGHALKKVVSHHGPDNLVSAALALDFDYDSAERRRTVTDAKANRPLKELTYDPTRGRLVTQTRFNYFPDSTYKVTDTFGYDSQTGRPTSKETDIIRTDIAAGATSTQTFNHAYDYTELAAPAHVKYPTCLGCGGFAAGSRDLLLGYQHGFLTGIEGVTTPDTGTPGGITYTPAGAVYQVRHQTTGGAAGVLETFAPDPSGMSRVGSIQFDGLLPPICLTVTAANPTIQAGHPAHLTVTVTGTGPFQYKWYLGPLNNRSNLVGTADHHDTLPLSQSTDYWVEVTNACGSATTVIHVVVGGATAPKILVPPASVTKQMTSSGDTILLTTNVLASGEGTLTYEWLVDGASAPCTAASETNGPEPCVPQTGASYTWRYVVPAVTPLTAHRTVKVKVSSEYGWTESATVTLKVVNAPPQEVYAYQPMSSLYAPGHSATLFVHMFPHPSAQHSYAYEWFEDDGTPTGHKLNGTGDEILVQTSSISRFWARITGTHQTADGPYTEVTLSPTMYVYRYGSCELPRLDVSQSLSSIPAGTSSNVVFTAVCDWPGVEFQWFEGPSGDTRTPLASDPANEAQLTVGGGTARPYWVRASLDCGAFQDSPTLTFTNGACGPVLFNQNIPSKEIAYGGNTSLQVDPVAMASPTYTWYREGQSSPVGVERVLLLNNVTKSGRYWVRVRSEVCSSQTDSFIATVRVASAPSITPPQWPLESWTDKGTSKALSAAAGGATGYEWFAGEVGDEEQQIAGAVSSTYNTQPLSADTNFWARIHGSGSEIVDSPTLTVRVCEAPHLTASLSLNYNVVLGQWASFGLPLTGTGPLQYKWYQGEVGDTSLPVGMPVDKLRIQPNSTTKYWARVTSPCGVNGSDPRTYDSPNFTVSVCPVLSAPTATKTIVMPGTSTTISIAATGTDLTYQWYIGGSGDKTQPLVGSTSATMTTPALTLATSFWCEVKSGDCPRSSETVTVNICQPLYLGWSGANDKVARSHYQTLGLTGVPIDGTTSFQWYKGQRLDTSTPLSTQIDIGISPTETTSYWVHIANGETGCYNDTTAFTVNVCIPTITAQPQPLTINTGATASMSVGVDLTGADLAQVTYQWYAGPSGNTSNPVSGQTSATLTASPTVNTSYWVRVTGGCNISRDSAAALVSICAPAAITMQPQDRNVTANFTIGVSVGATGTDLTYQWYRGLSGDTTNPLVGKTSAAFDIALSETTDFWVRVSGSCGAAVNSNTMKISIPPSIQTQPFGGGVVMPGTIRTLTVAATGTQLRYEWHKVVGTSDTVVGGATASYTTPGITADVSYYCRIYSGNNHRDSASVAFTVCSLPNLNWGSVQTQVAASQFQTLSVSGIPAETPKSYQWYRGTAGDISNPLSTQPTYGISPAVTTSYWVRVTTTDTGCWVDATTVTVNVCRPSITTQPTASSTIDKIANPNAFATLTVAANITPVTYQWYIGQPGNTANPISGATASAYNASPASDTTYWVRVSGNCGVSADSAAATVIVCRAPQITQHPGSLTSPPNFSRQLSVTATGTDLTYNWYVGTTGITTTPIGGNASTVTISPSQTTDYWVRVTGRCGTVNSNFAKISIAPSITTHPVGGPITSGTTRTLTVVANGSQLRYEWYRRSGAVDTIISGATAASYTTPAITANTTYFARVFSGNASFDSAEAVFTVCLPRSISTSGWTGVSGTPVTLRVIDPAAGETYEWYRGATGNTSALIGNNDSVVVSPLESTQYWLRTKRTGCDADTAAITVAVCIPKITTQPQSAMITSGSTRTLTVAATGTPAMTYQWYIGASGTSTTPISGATNSSYTTPALTTTTTYWVRITSPQQSCAFYSVSSAAATVSVCQPPAITQQPSDKTFNGVGSVSLSVTATGDGLTYQWYEGASGVTTNPVGTNSNTLTMSPSITKWYWVRVTGTCGTLNSNAALVSVFPKILAHPADTALCGLGASASFSVNATGSSLTYQWYRAYNGQQPVAVGTTPSVTIPIGQVPVQVWCEVKSGNAVTTSNAAGITEVLSAPTVYSITKTPMSGGRFVLQSNVAPADQNLVLWKWYQGALGDTSVLIDSGYNTGIIVQPSSLPKAYWLRVAYQDTGCATDKAVTVP